MQDLKYPALHRFSPPLSTEGESKTGILDITGVELNISIKKVKIKRTIFFILVILMIFEIVLDFVKIHVHL